MEAKKTKDVKCGKCGFRKSKQHKLPRKSSKFSHFTVMLVVLGLASTMRVLQHRLRQSLTAHDVAKVGMEPACRLLLKCIKTCSFLNRGTSSLSTAKELSNQKFILGPSTTAPPASAKLLKLPRPIGDRPTCAKEALLSLVG